MESGARETLRSPLTFLEAVPERARAAHGAGLFVKGHARVPQAVVAEGVKGDVLVGQAVVPQTSDVDLSGGCRAGGCEDGEGN